MRWRAPRCCLMKLLNETIRKLVVEYCFCEKIGPQPMKRRSDRIPNMNYRIEGTLWDSRNMIQWRNAWICSLNKSDGLNPGCSKLLAVRSRNDAAKCLGRKGKHTSLRRIRYLSNFSYKLRKIQITLWNIPKIQEFYEFVPSNRFII